jgi:hypothetical protein
MSSTSLLSSLASSSVRQIWSHPTWDVLLLFALLGGGFFYGIAAGRQKISFTIIYTYIAYALFSALPLERYVASLTFTRGYLLKAGSFVVLFLLLAALGGVMKRQRGFASPTSWGKVFLLSFLQVGLFAHIFLGFLPKEKIAILAPFTKYAVANPDLNFFWFIAPIAAVLFLKRLDS